MRKLLLGIFCGNFVEDVVYSLHDLFCNIWGCVSLTDPVLIVEQYYILVVLVINIAAVKSDVWTVSHYLGLYNETTRRVF